MEETRKVKIIFTDLDWCPCIIMPSEVYNTEIVDKFFNKNENENIKFDHFVYHMRQIPDPEGVIHCNSFITWWANNSTHKYYWPKWKMTINISRGYHIDWVRIGGLMKKEYDINSMKKPNGITAVYYNYDKDFDMSLAMRGMRGDLIYMRPTSSVHIKDVIFNDPATIVFWSDGTKTVCTCSEQDIYDPEKGLALCVMKKMLYNNKGHIFNNAREKWLKKGNKR